MKYIVKFEKKGTICYTSHLDIMKVFKRSFKRAGIKLEYSKGFNPHPKMSFAQPLSLGYESDEEFIEFETAEGWEEMSAEEIVDNLRQIMPEGLTLLEIREADLLRKTLAAETVSAEYEIKIPLEKCVEKSGRELWEEYMGQQTIVMMKKQKKKKDPVPMDIKPKIRSIAFQPEKDVLIISTLLDAGSQSNLSPELLMDSIIAGLGVQCDRHAVEVTRKKIHFMFQQ